jgi:S1-C subfamily serine protease
MKLCVYAALAVFGTLLYLAQPSALEDFNAAIEQTNVFLPNGCSGTIIDLDEALVLTAAHCISPMVSKPTIIRDPEGNPRQAVRPEVELQNPYVRRVMWADIVKMDRNIDLALLRVTRSATVPRVNSLRDLGFTKAREIVPSTERLLRGMRAYAVGNPLLLRYTLTEGIISFAHRRYRIPVSPERPVDMHQFDARIAGGSSGGALIDEKGRLLGVVSFANALVEPMTGSWVDRGQSWAVSNTTINEFLK